MSKHSKRSKESRKDTSGICDYAKWQRESTESDEKTDHQKMIERRKSQAPGVDICPECGGVMFNIDGIKKCGDCGSRKGEGSGNLERH